MGLRALALDMARTRGNDIRGKVYKIILFMYLIL